MPTTVWARRSRTTARPTTVASSPNLRRQNGVGQNRDGLLPFVLLPGERAAERGLEHRESGKSDHDTQGGLDALRLIDPRELVVAVAERGDRLERGRPLQQPVIVGRGESDRMRDRFGNALIQDHEPIRVTIRKRAKQHRIDGAEDRRRRADGERQRHDDRGAEQRRLPHAAQRRIACPGPERDDHVRLL